MEQAGQGLVNFSVEGRQIGLVMQHTSQLIESHQIWADVLSRLSIDCSISVILL